MATGKRLDISREREHIGRQIAQFMKASRGNQYEAISILADGLERVLRKVEALAPEADD